MNTITDLAAAVSLGTRPGISYASMLLIPIALAGVAVIASNGNFLRSKTGRFVPALLISTIVVFLAATGGVSAYALSDGARANTADDAWRAEFATWAEDAYGVETGTDEIYAGFECPAYYNKCLKGKVLIGERVTEVTIVTMGERTLMLRGDGESGKEMPRVDR